MTSTYRLSDHVSDTMTDHEWRPILGKRAVFTTYDGERVEGTVETPSAMSSWYPVIRFDNGQWGRCDDLVELVD